jgi:hypothetical protein
MARYIAHPEIENKFMCSLCDYGSNGLSRQSVNNHFKKTHTEPENTEVEEPEIVIDEPPIIDPEWMKVRDTEEGEVKFSSLPPAAKGALKFFSSNREAPKAGASLKAFYSKQGKMLTWFFRGIIDPLIQAYGRGVIGGEKGKDFSIKRSKDEWQLFEGIATEWVEYREVSIPVSPDMLMLGCVGSFYVPPLKVIHQKRDPSKPSLFGRLKMRVAKWKVNREIKRRGVEHFES